MNPTYGRSLKEEIKRRTAHRIRKDWDLRHAIDPFDRLESVHASAKRLSTIPCMAATARPIHQSREQRDAEVLTSHLSQRSLDWMMRPRRIILLAATAITAICVVISLIVRSQPLPQQKLVPLPTSDTNTVMSYLRSVGVPMTDVQMVAAPNANWKARSEVQFGIDSDGTAGFFVLLNYASPDQAALDAFKAAYRSPFQDWHLTQIANFLLLSTPDTAQALKTMIASHLTHLLLAPYRAFIPTATPAGKQ